MDPVSFSFYDAFSDDAFGGSQAGVITDAQGLSEDLRKQIAREIGAPATAFVDACSNNTVVAQFYSTVMELPMCGHGTICLMTRLIETGGLVWDDSAAITVELRLPSRLASVEINRRDDGRH